MRFAVVGVGGLGGYFGGRLVRAGEDVTFIARGAHLDALLGRGLEVRSVHGDFSVDVRATDDAASVGPVDVVLFLVKTYDNDSAARDAAPLVGEGTAIVSLQNGVDNAVRIRDAIGRGHALGGLAYTEAALEAPGIVAQYSQTHRVVIGELAGGSSPLVNRIVESLRGAGLDASASRHIVSELWTKWTFICALGGVTAACRQPIGPILASAETRALFIDAMREVEAVARRKGVALERDVVDRHVQFAQSSAPTLKSSMLRDAERGRPLEVEALNGRVATFGSELKVPTPVNSFIYATLLPAHRVALSSRSPDLVRAT
jgi:2-dehydropantoate 2-reductase